MLTVVREWRRSDTSGAQNRAVGIKFSKANVNSTFYAQSHCHTAQIHIRTHIYTHQACFPSRVLLALETSRQPTTP